MPKAFVALHYNTNLEMGRKNKTCKNVDFMIEIVANQYSWPLHTMAEGQEAVDLNQSN